MPEKQTNEKPAKSYEYNTSLQVYQRFREFFDDCPYKEKDIMMYLSDPQTFNRELRRLAEWAYRVNGSISAVVNYAKSIHTLDSVIVCKSVRKSKRKPRNFDSNSRLFNQALDVIRYRDVIRDMIQRCCVEGTYFYYLETSDPVDINKKTMRDMDVRAIRQINASDLNVTIISLPTDFCKIVGRKNNSYVAAFNLRYILNAPTVEEKARILRGLPSEIREAWSVYEVGKSDDWVVLDNDHTIIGKVRSRLLDAWGEPLVLPALDDVLYIQDFIKTKRNVLDQMNHQIIYQVFPEGSVPGVSPLTNEQQAEQHEVVKQAVLNHQNRSGTSFFSLPGGTKINTLEVDGSIFTDDTETDVRDNVPVDIGLSPSVLNGKSSGNYATSTLNVELFSSFIYTFIDEFINELNKAMNACVIRDSSCPVGVYILPATFVNRDKMVEQMRQLYTTGKGSLTMWIASTGINPDAYLSLMDYELAEDWEHKYPVHVTSYTAPSDSLSSGDAADESETGRPTTDSVESPTTVSTKTNGSNDAPKPSV